MSQTAKFIVSVPEGLTSQINVGPYHSGVEDGRGNLQSVFTMLNSAYPGLIGSVTDPSAMNTSYEVELAQVIQQDPNMPLSGYDADGTLQLVIGSDIGPLPVEVVRRNVYTPPEE
jgi:hypothetical protein